MTATEREPTRDELLAQAYVDNELPEPDRRTFEERLAREPELGREVAELQGLAVIARQVAPPEPMDYEWQRLAADPLQRATLPLGFALLLIALVGLAGVGIFGVATADDIDLLPKALILSAFGGIALVFFAVLRGRIRTRPLDPYTNVQR